MMESSRNIGYKNFQVLKLFTKDLVKALKVGHSKTEIALLTYSEYVSKHLDFNKFKGKLYYIIFLEYSISSC